MQITVNETDMQIKDGKLIININSDLEKVLNSNKMVLSSVKAGDIIIGKSGTKWIVFRHNEDGSTNLLRDDLLQDDRIFDENSSNFAKSDIDKYLNVDYIKEAEADFGKENILYQNIDLTSLDGLTDYGIYRTKIGLPTIDDYRYGRKSEIIKNNMPRTWCFPHQIPHLQALVLLASGVSAPVALWASAIAAGMAGVCVRFYLFHLRSLCLATKLLCSRHIETIGRINDFFG